MIIARSKNKIPGDQGQIWHVTIGNEVQIHEMVQLANQCHENPSKPRFTTINDGMRVTLTLIQENTISFAIKEFEENTNAQMLIQKLLEICRKSVGSSFDKYALEIESHFKSW